MSKFTDEPPFPKSLKDEAAINACAIYLLGRYATFRSTVGAMEALSKLADGFATDARENKTDPHRFEYFRIQQEICEKTYGLLATKGRTARQ